MPIHVSDVIEVMEELAPPWLAQSGDPIGLHAGSRRASVSKVLVALDATQQVVELARRKKCQMIIAHHPRFYRGLPNLNQEEMLGAIGHALIKHDIALYCAHTNLDTAAGGVNDTLAEACGLPRSEIFIRQTAMDHDCKLVVFVPDSHLAKVRDALADAGAGMIGEYSDCAFRTPGVGSFRGSAQSQPVLGEAGKFEEVEEWRLEMIFPESRSAFIKSQLCAAHPYEEPAYDIYRLLSGTAYGLGRMGALPRPITLEGLARKLKKNIGASGVRYLGDGKRKIAQLAVWGGGGVPAAEIANRGPDAVVCGEMGYHDTEILLQAGVQIVLLGHGPSEDIALLPLAKNLGAALPAVRFEVSPSLWPRAIGV